VTPSVDGPRISRVGEHGGRDPGQLDTQEIDNLLAPRELGAPVAGVDERRTTPAQMVVDRVMA
jgi:hypothetical protein